MKSLLWISLRESLRRPLQSALLVVGVAIGVAVVVAVDIANASSLAAFRLSTEVVSGRATHRIVGGPRGLDADVYRRLRSELGYELSAPVVEGLITVDALGGAPLTVLGVDPLAEAPFRDLLGFGTASATGAAGSVGPGLPGAPGAPADSAPAEGLDQDQVLGLIADRQAVMITEGLAARHDVGVGSPMTATAGSRVTSIRVAGLLRPGDEASRSALDSVIVADIGAAQHILGRPAERIDRIDLIVPAGEVGAETLDAIRGALPDGASIVPASEAQATVESMTEAFHLNLTALSLLALLVGMFLIFNTVRFRVVERRPTLAILRSLGVTGGEIFTATIAETLATAVIGIVLGLGLGILLGRGAVDLVTRTVNDLYFVVQVSQIEVSPTGLAKAAGLGMVAALVAAGVPALEATRVPPVTALRRSEVESRSRRGAPTALAGSGLAFAAALGLLAVPGEGVAIAFVALACFVAAVALAAPMATLAAMAAVRPLTAAAFGPLGSIAPRAVRRSLSRTSVAIAALGIAVCVSVGVRIMITSFRTTVDTWLETTLTADVFVSPPSVGAGRVTGALDPEAVEALRRLQGVRTAYTAVGVVAQSPRLGPTRILAADSDIAEGSRPYIAAAADNREVWEAIEAGAVAVSEPFAERHDVGVGDAIDLITDAGARSFPIVGVYRDYSSDRGLILMSRAVYREAWNDDRITSVALFLEPDFDAGELAAEIESRYGSRFNLQAQSNRDLRAGALEVFDRAFTITAALRLLAITVAFIGVFTALLSLQLERSRELATLRATGLTQRQLAGLSLLETALMGIVAGLLAWPAGWGLAMILTHVINRRSFGWSLESEVHPAVFAEAMLVAVSAALIAGIYPAVRLGRQPIARALREE